MDKYDHTKIESKWQKKWEKEGLYVTDLDKKKKFYNLWMFPYPSAEGLHAGHAFASTGSDVYGRFQRMNGYEVFQPIGYDSFGIHSENYAIKIGEDPHTVVKRTTHHYEDQMRSLGHGYDWSRTVTTSSPDYYKWTQWLFIQMFKAGLAYKKKASVNFCPSCKTVLADEQVMTPKQAGKEPKDASGQLLAISDQEAQELKVCERCGTVAEKKELDQWFFRITDYAEGLLEGLNRIDWSERVKIAQKEWIGKKEGVLVNHKVKDMDLTLTAFSAYPAWLFADTFLVIAPEHSLVPDLVRGTKLESDVLKFVENFKNKKSGKGRKLDEKEGIFTGRYVYDPLTGREFPVWLANFALVEFGTGIIRCSAHDPRDYEFAKKYKIPLEEVVERTNINEPVNAHLNKGKLTNSSSFTGREINEKLISDIVDWIVKNKFGEKNVNYHLRDWLVSRQRYWGAPIPMIYCKNCADKNESWFDSEEAKKFPKIGNWKLEIGNSDRRSVGWWPVEELPVLLPLIKDYKPEGNGRGPLANHKEFYEVKCPHCGKPATRETDVMDTFVDSSWYFLRYPSVNENSKFQIPNSKQIENCKLEIPWDPEITRCWLPVDLYFGGAEHSVLHLMYARFVTKVLHDLGFLAFDEPFPKFFAHGLMIKDGAKMSKSRGNVVNPDEYVNKFGADVMRCYEMFLGPMDGYPDFRDSGIEGMQRFLKRVWGLFSNSKLQMPNAKSEDNKEVTSKLHKTIKGVTEDIEGFRYNTAIAKIMELVNFLSQNSLFINHNSLFILCKLLAPFAPHMMEEVWCEVLHQPFSIHKAQWPVYDPKQIKSDQATVVVQINGKVRDSIKVMSSESNSQEKMEEKAMKSQKIVKLLDGQMVKKVIFVPGKVINFVV